MSRLPLTALRVFEAAARRGSFLRAADELAVTPGAVSRQIKALEAELGVRLFERFNRAVRLTEAGAGLAEGVRKGLGVIEAAVDETTSRRSGPLAVTTMHSLAARWLVPRLHLFHERHPDVQVLISASDAMVDLVRDRIDLAVRFGRGPFPGLAATKLMDAPVFPVCSPRLLEQTKLATPADLAGVLLLSSTFDPAEPDWPSWFAAAGVPSQAGASAMQFSNTYLAIEAALAGRGVALAQLSMVADELAAGRLVRPFDTTVEGMRAHWIVTLPEKADLPDVRRFRTWLLAQAAADGLRPDVE